MFDYIYGHLIEAGIHKVTIDVGGLGYLVLISIATFEKLPPLKEKIKVYTTTVFREDSQNTYGFLSKEERDCFEMLNEISGIGPRLALSLLGHMTLSDLHTAVLHENTKALSGIPGIGKKMAEKLVIELRDKFQKEGKRKGAAAFIQSSSSVLDAISALTNLGYTPLEAQKAVHAVLEREKEEPSLAELITFALKVKK